MCLSVFLPPVCRFLLCRDVSVQGSVYSWPSDALMFSVKPWESARRRLRCHRSLLPHLFPGVHIATVAGLTPDYATFYAKKGESASAVKAVGLVNEEEGLVLPQVALGWQGCWASSGC